MKLRHLLVMALLAGTHSTASSAEADARALEACKLSSSTFVGVADCLPDAHVAFRALDAFAKIFPAQAQVLRTRCVELNEGDIAGSLTCVRQALKSAAELLDSMPAGAKLDDPVFDALSDKSQRDAFEAEIETAKKAFPDKAIWGGNFYKPYK